MNPEEISKTIDDYHKLETMAINAIKRINGDVAYDLTINVIEKYSLLDIDYMYSSCGYSYDDNLIIPIKMLDASDIEIEEFKEKRRKEAERAAEENKLLAEKEKIKQEKAELERLKKNTKHLKLHNRAKSHEWCATIISNFKGTVEYKIRTDYYAENAKWNPDESLVVCGHGKKESADMAKKDGKPFAFTTARTGL